MCQFLSLVATKSGKIYGDGSYDSHGEIIKENKDTQLKDDKLPSNNTFARVEVIPKDDNIFNHKIENWEVRVDESIKPKWWNNKLEKKCIERLKEVFKKQFLIGGKYKIINRDIRFIKDVEIEILKSKVGEMYDYSQVGKMYDSSQVGEMYDYSQVGKMYDSSQVGDMYDYSQVGKMYDSSQVGKMWNYSQVGKMWNYSQVGEMYENTTINIYSKDAIVKKQIGGRTVIIKRYLRKVKVSIK